LVDLEGKKRGDFHGSKEGSGGGSG